MALEDILQTFIKREQPSSPLTARWYIVAAVALAASSAGPGVPKLYQLATQGLSLDDQKLVQRRIKEAILKASCLYGVPRSLQALLPLFATLKDDEIDHYGPRWEARNDPDAAKQREAKGRAYFDVLWTPAAAEANRQKNFKYQPDLYLLNQKSIYETHMSEDAILGPVETQMCNAAALICFNCPTQAMWHTRGIVRHGGTMEEAKFAQDLGLSIAELYGCKTGVIVKVEDIDFDDAEPH